jgi:CheY-like chemotaxis protein
MVFSCGFTSFLREGSSMGLLTAREAAKYLHISLFTLGKIEKERLMVPFRTPGGHRRYSLEMLNEYLECTRSQLREPEGRVLIVDDGDELTHILSKAFPSCTFASAGDELQVGMKVAEFKPDLILVDTSMKALDGRALCRRLDGPGQDLDVLSFHRSEESGPGALANTIDPADLGLVQDRIASLLGLDVSTTASPPRLPESALQIGE